MKISPMYAQMLIKSHEEKIDILLSEEKNEAIITSFPDEDTTRTRRKYQYASIQHTIDTLEDNIITLKHALHQFNTTTTLPNQTITIDEAMMKIRYMKKKLKRIKAFRQIPIITRSSNHGKPEYSRLNYDEKDLSEDYKTTEKTLIAYTLGIEQLYIQRQLDVNITMEQITSVLD